MSDIAQSAPSPFERVKPWLTSPWALIVYLMAGLALLDPGQFVPIGEIAVGALAGTLPYIAIAVLLLAYLKAAGAEAMIAEAFKGRETRMIVLAALFGGLAPFCSCQVIPFVAGLLALGTPLPAVMAFWLSSPLIDPSSVLITAAALGWPMAIAKTISAVGLGLFGGFALKGMMGAGFFKNALRADAAPSSCCCKARASVSKKPVWQFWHEGERRTIFRAEMTANVLFLFKWLALAYVLEGLLVTYVPAQTIAGVVGGSGIGSIATAAIVGMPAYLNSYIAPPMVAGLMQQGMGSGAGLAFMVAGAVSSIPAMAAIWSLVRRPVFAAYIAFGVIGAIIAGAVFELVV